MRIWKSVPQFKDCRCRKAYYCAFSLGHSKLTKGLLEINMQMLFLANELKLNHLLLHSLSYGRHCILHITSFHMDLFCAKQVYTMQMKSLRLRKIN